MMPNPPLKLVDPNELQKMLEAVQKIDPAVVALTAWRSTGMAVFVTAQPNAASAAGPQPAAAVVGGAVAPVVWADGEAVDRSAQTLSSVTLA